jgi:hypothetical protein
MIAGDPHRPADDESADVLANLERLAGRLDAERFPGQAWPCAARRRAGRSAWKIAASLIAAAASVAIAVQYLPSWQPDVAPAAGRGDVVAGAAAPAESRDAASVASPQLVIVEDLDSYSVIDLTAGVPVVSYATKEMLSMACVVPLPPAPPAEQPMSHTEL